MGSGGGGNVGSTGIAFEDEPPEQPTRSTIDNSRRMAGVLTTRVMVTVRKQPGDVRGSEVARRAPDAYGRIMASPIPHNWDVPQIFRDRFGTRAGRQRVMAAEGHLLIILHDLPKADDPDTVTARLYWRKPDGTWRSQGSGVTNINALRAHVEDFVVAIDGLEARARKATRAKDWFGIMHDAAPLFRAVRNQSAALQEARELATSDRELIAIRDTAQENERAMELIATHARAGLDYTIAANAEENAANSEHVVQSQHRLNLIAATFLPISALGALFGINLKHGFEDWHAPYAFWVVAGAAFLLGLLVRWSLPSANKIS